MHKSYAAISVAIAISVSTWLLNTTVPAIGVQPDKALPRAHAHNDYLHEHPLQDALDHGFSSVEADIYLVEGKLLVAHDRPNLRSERTLQKLYLDPLKARAAKYGGRVSPDCSQFNLLIDIKSDAEPTYRALHDVLAQYGEILTTVDSGHVDEHAVTVIISGNRPSDYIASQSRRYCGIDGRISDLDSDKPAHLLPWISDNWNLHFAWRGEGPVPAKDREHLREIVRRAHAKGRQVRFWATPDKRTVWQLLAEEQVDWINTDDLFGLEEFLTAGR